ncbi:Mss4p nuclear export [Mucor velutinosus]|uniref:Mss4p nuclear export n=1 Tax=Mucor velutinosus TaxID=708070 RepID=A0AAN7DM87_9FUNG|nr:Mss4p nuclear export [Mucor velutinosus]
MTHLTNTHRLFSFVSREDMYRRLKRIENGCVDSIGDEARHLNTYYLHPLIRTDLYHFPLSPNYYIKQINKDGKEEYIHHSTHENTGEVYTRCSDCTAFVKRKRKTLKTATQKALGTGVASYDSLMEFMINSNTTCALTGIKGSWSSFPGDPMYLLSLDHKIPLRAGGSSYIDNLQVTLQSFNNIKGDFEAEDFKRWFTAIKQMPKV